MQSFVHPKTVCVPAVPRVAFGCRLSLPQNARGPRYYSERLETVNFPEPYAGLIIHYAYLWKSAYDAGREEGTKDRPCVIVMTVAESWR
jgi:hypothetical protein